MLQWVIQNISKRRIFFQIHFADSNFSYIVTQWLYNDYIFPAHWYPCIWSSRAFKITFWVCPRNSSFVLYSSYEEFQTTKTTKISSSLEGLKVTLERCYETTVHTVLWKTKWGGPSLSNQCQWTFGKKRGEGGGIRPKRARRHVERYKCGFSDFSSLSVHILPYFHTERAT